MPHRSWEFRIADIVEAIDKIINYTSSMSFDQFCEDSKTIDAVIRNFTIIGEAASALSHINCLIHCRPLLDLSSLGT